MPTKREFIQSVRQKYPQYNGIEDNELFDKIITKYPMYKESITDIETAQEPEGFLAKAKDLFTGESRMTPEIKEMKSLGELPEFNKFDDFTLRSFIAPLVTTSSFNDEEIAKALKINFPDLEIQQDSKGNYFVHHPKYNENYAINKPGLDMRDIGKAAFLMSTFGRSAGIPSLVGRMAASGATQTAIEGIQSLAGGDFNKGEVAGAVVAEPISAVASSVLKTGAQGVSKAKQSLKNVFESVTEEVPVEKMGLQELGKTARSAVDNMTKGGREKAVQKLAKEAIPDEKIVQSAKRLGIEEYLQPDQMTSNQAFQEMSQAIKSIPGSKAKQLEREGLEKSVKKVEKILDDIGGTDDFSTLSKTIRDQMKTTQDELFETAESLYKKLGENIDPKLKVKPKNILNFLDDEIDQIGSIDDLSPMEKSIYNQVSREDGVNYALFDRIRKKLTAAKYKKQGEFADAETGLIKKLEQELMKDQKDIAESLEQGELFRAARETVAVRKALEQDMQSLFGKNLDQGVIQKLTTGTKQLAKGDSEKFVKLMNAIPKEQRQDATVSALRLAVGKNAKDGTLNLNNFGKFHRELKKNKQAYNALMTNLPKGARQQFQDIANVSDIVADASRKQITTGKIKQVDDLLNGSDNLISNVYDITKQSIGKSLLYEPISYGLGLPGAGTVAALANTMGKGKKNLMEVADELFASSAFRETVKNIGTDTQEQSIRKFSKSKAFRTFYNKLGKPEELSNPEKWLRSAIQATRQVQEKEIEE